MRRFTLVLLVCLSGSMAKAADVVPAVELRVRAATDMLEVFDYLLKLVPNDEQYQQYLKMAKTFGESKNGFLGLDPKKPIGAYVGIANEVADSPVVLMVPVAVEKDFLALLKDFLKLDPKKLEGDLYSFIIPNIPAGPGYFRFAHGYAYVTIRSAKSIDLERLIQPKDFFAEKHPDILNVKMRIERFPADIRKAILGQLELGWHEAIAALQGTPLERAGWKFAVDVGADMLKTILEEGQSLDFAVKIMPKTDDIAMNLTLTPKPGTGLGKFLKEQGTRESKAASMFLEPETQTVMRFGLNITLPKLARNKFADFADLAIAESKWQDDDKTDVKGLQKIVRAHLMKGEIGMSMRMKGDAKTKTSATSAAVGVTDGESLVKILKTAVARHGEKRFAFDVHKPDAYHYHTMKLPDAVPEDQPSFVATGEKVWALGSTLPLLQQSLAQKPKAAPFFIQELCLATSIGTPELVEKYFGKDKARDADRIFISIDGGDALTIDLAIKGKYFPFSTEASRLRKAK